MRFTVFGSSGYIGRQLSNYLHGLSYEVLTPERSTKDWLERTLALDLGHVFYCVGLTSDFRTRPFDTYDAHVGLLKRILQVGKMDSLIYLSSSRIYEGAFETSECACLTVNPANLGHVYNISKLAGESLCLNSGRQVKIARLSNVYGDYDGSDNFLGAILNEAASTGSLRLQTSPHSSKDFIHINNVVSYLQAIALQGKHQIYNLASGVNTTNEQIVKVLESEGIKISYSEKCIDWSFPPINIQRLESEFGKASSTFLQDLPGLLNTYREKTK